MKKIWHDWLEKLDQIPGSAWQVGLTLLGVTILGYGLLLPKLGLYTDDWTFLWVFDRMGPVGLHDYFTVNRPFWGLVYQLTMPLLGRDPIVLHIYGLVWRWLVTLAFWGMVRVVWPRAKRQAFWASLVFLLYPGFALQYISLCTGNMWLVLAFCLASFILTGKALRQRDRYWVYTFMALLFSLANVLMMEYFLPLELTRLLVIYAILSEAENGLGKKLRHTFYHWLPFGLILLIVVLWRVFFFSNQTFTYPLLLIQRFRADALDGFVHLLKTIPVDLFQTTLGAWGRLVGAPQEFQPAGSTLVLYGILIVAGLLLFTALFMRKKEPTDERRFQWAWSAILFGFLSMLTAGWPFWVTELSIEPLYFNSRFTMPFILGSSLFLVGLLELVRWRWVRSMILIFSLAGALGVQFLIANDFRLDWIANQRLMQQVYTRVPALAEGSTVLFNTFDMRYTSTATFTAEINLLYPAVGKERTAYGAQVARLVDDWQEADADTPIEVYLIIETYWGKVGRSVLAYYPSYDASIMPPPNCLWFVDQSYPPLFQDFQRIQSFSEAGNILTGTDLRDPENFYVRLLGLDKNREDDCILFQQADLARQEGDWAQVTETARQLEEHHSELLKRLYSLIFIQGYGMQGEWQKAVELSQDLAANLPGHRSKVCAIWELLDDQAPPGAGKTEALTEIKQGLCADQY